MLILGAALVLVLLVPLAGGRFGNLARLRLRGTWLVVAALLVQIVVISIVTDAPEWVSKTFHLSTYVALGVFVLLNRRVPFMWVLVLGVLANFVVIAANGGVMPASATALRSAGRAVKKGFNNSAVLSHPRLRFLGDVFSTPRSLPMANVFSVGDVVLVVGLVLMAFAVTRTDVDADVPYLRPLEDAV